MAQIGIMGGTFNPIHNAHLLMAQTALQQAHLQEIWFMPSGNPPHKPAAALVSEKHRRRMVQLAVQGIPGFCFSDFELCRQGTTYTAETVRQLQEENPTDTFSFLMGEDSLFQIETWYHPEQIMKRVTLLVVPRGTEASDTLQQKAEQLRRTYQAAIMLLSMPRQSISSSLIRQRLYEGKSIHGFVPETVEQYIKANHLYQAGDPYDKI